MRRDAARPGERERLAAWSRQHLAPIKWRLVGLGIVALLYLGLWLSVTAGDTGLVGVLITIPVLGLLVAGGNWFQQWLGVQRRAPEFSNPRADDHDPPPPAP